MLTLITNGDLYDPTPRGRISVLVANDKILKVGDVDEEAVKRLGFRVRDHRRSSKTRPSMKFSEVKN
jgi:hypothetical protein